LLCLLINYKPKDIVLLIQTTKSLKRNKQHMIASYLGITTVVLSQIKTKINFVNIGY
jgi:hypothetical protein